MATKNNFFSFGKFAIRDGLEIRFWEDKWLGNTPLKDQYPALYNIVRHKSDTLATVMQSSPPVVTFGRDLVGPKLEAWNALLERLAMVQLSTGKDIFRWTLNENGKFSVDSMYRALIQSDMPVDKNKKLWKMKIPLNFFFHSTLVGELSSPKITLLSVLGREVQSVFSVYMMR